MSREAQRSKLLAEYLEAVRAERHARQVLSECGRSGEDCTGAFLLWKRASEASRALGARWQAAVAVDGSDEAW